MKKPSGLWLVSAYFCLIAGGYFSIIIAYTFELYTLGLGFFGLVSLVLDPLPAIAVSIIFGILFLLAGWSIWTLKSWSWTYGISLLIISMVINVYSSGLNSLISLILPIIAIAYLYFRRDLFKI